MNKFLRYSLSLVLAFVTSVTFAQEVTFDFDNDYKTLFPELTGTSSSDSKDGPKIRKQSQWQSQLQ